MNIGFVPVKNMSVGCETFHAMRRNFRRFPVEDLILHYAITWNPKQKKNIDGRSPAHRFSNLSRGLDFSPDISYIFNKLGNIVYVLELKLGILGKLNGRGSRGVNQLDAQKLF